jgi:hypothetical protein
MPDHPKRPRDFSQADREPTPDERGKDPAARWVERVEPQGPLR